MLLLLIPGVGMGAGGAALPVIPTVTTEPIRPSGGWPSTQGERGRSRKEVSEARKRLGLDDGYRVSTIIADVAARQADRIEQDQQKIFEELLRELELQGLEFDARYLEALAVQRQRLIDAEIASRFQKMLLDDEELMLLVMIAAASTNL